METYVTVRETEVLKLFCSGLAYKDIAHKLGISKKTVDAHLLNTHRRLGEYRELNQRELLVLCLQRGVLRLTDLPAILPGVEIEFSAERHARGKGRFSG